MTAVDVFEKLNNEDKRRYVAQHAPSILCALIMRRASTDPDMLIDPAIEAAASLYDSVGPPVPRNGNGRAVLQERRSNGIQE